MPRPVAVRPTTPRPRTRRGRHAVARDVPTPDLTDSWTPWPPPTLSARISPLLLLGNRPLDGLERVRAERLRRFGVLRETVELASGADRRTRAPHVHLTVDRALV